MKKEKLKNYKSNKGITLIALIITIVVMLILVAVTLSVALGQNGVVNTAKDAAEKTNIEKEKEELELLVGEWEMEKVKGSNKDLKTFLSEKYGEGNVVEDENGIITVTTAEGEKLVLDTEGKVSIDSPEDKEEDDEENIELPTVPNKLTLNRNGDSIFTDEYLGKFDGWGKNSVAKLAYKADDKSIKIESIAYDTVKSTSLIIVQYYENEKLTDRYTLRESESSYFNEDGSGTNIGCQGYPHYPKGWSDESVVGYCDCESYGGKGIFRALPTSEYPVFSGEWEIDLENSNNDGIKYLINVLVGA